MTEIYLHIVARMADYMDTHLGEESDAEPDIAGASHAHRDLVAADVHAQADERGGLAPQLCHAGAAALLALQSGPASKA